MKQKWMGYLAFVTALTMCAGLLSGCNRTESADSSTVSSASADSTDPVQAETLGALQAASLLPLTLDPEDLEDSWDETAVRITLSGDTGQASGSGVTIADSIVTITQPGTYVVSGTLEGILAVDAPKEQVHLVFDGVTLTNAATAPVQIRDAEKVVLTLAEGSSNQVTDGTAYTEFTDAEQTEPNGAVFAKSDLTINGKGTLEVTGQYSNGIQSKDTLCIAGGEIRITAANHGLKGKDAVLIAGGSLEVDAQGDGIQASNDKDSQKGYVVISGGKITVNAGEDGIQAETCLAVTGGELSVTAGGGSANAPAHRESMPGFGKQTNSSADTDTSTVSTKGLKASTELYITGGTISVDARDDGLHSNGSMTIAGGTLSIRTGDDGAHADSSLTVEDGEIRIEESYEGLEAVELYIRGGQVHITASDDGMNAAGSLSDTAAQGETTGYVQTAFGGMGMVDQDAKLEISGGYVYINAEGDGIDSNNGVTISGGTVLVCGPTSSADGALDSETGIVVNGGFLLAAGSSGMAEVPEDTSAQYAAAIGVDTQSAGTLLTITDKNGQVVCAFAPEKQYQHVVFSAPALQEGEAYTVTLGGSCSGTETDGLYTGGSCTGGTELTSFTVSDRITTAGSSAGGMNPQGGGRPGGQDGMTPPDGENMPQGTRPSFEGQDPPEDLTPPDGFDPNQAGKTPPGGFGGFSPDESTGDA